MSFPHSAEAELGVISSFLNNPKDVGGICGEMGITESHFHLPANNLMFRKLIEMWAAGSPIDPITLTQALRLSGDIESIGGAHVIAQAFTFLPTSANVRHYLEIIEEKRVMREVLKCAMEFQQRARDEQESAAAIVEEMSSRICSISSIRERVKAWTPRELIKDAANRAEERLAKRGMPNNVVKTGLSKLDDTMGGMPPGSYVILSGKEKSGKTSLAFNILEHVVFAQQKRSLVISMEMKAAEITDRMISSFGKIGLTKILNGWMTEADFPKFTATSAGIDSGKFKVFDDLFFLNQIIGAIRQEKVQNPDLEFVLIDYLQLIETEVAKKDGNREQVIATISRTLRRLANQLSLVFLVMVQLNEDGEVRESRAVGMDCTSHLRIEPPSDDDEKGKKWLRVVYQRNGPSNVGIPLTHLAEFVRFESYAGDPGEIPDPNAKRKRK